ncbi:MAG: CDP-alcohol phosphatidyltransferase family protein [Actinomycetes bacterium]
MTTEERTTTFGETAIMTPANLITIGRLVLTPVFIWMVMHWGSTWATAGVGAAVAFSDGIDGIVARKMGSTRSGAFLDPLIDKIVVLACMVTLVHEHKMFWLPVAIIAVRELWMSWYRTVASKRGISIPARKAAKIKTIVQDFAIAFVVLPPTANLGWLHVATIWAAAALTVWTGAEYYLDGRRAMAEATP